MEDDDLEHEMGIKSSLERETILIAINTLKTMGQKKNMTFWEYRSMNRKEVTRIMPMLTSAPRWAITLFDEIPEHGRPKKKLGEGYGSIQAGIEWLLIPEYYIFLHRNDIFGGLPGYLPELLIATFLLKILKIVKLTLIDRESPIMHLIGLVYEELLKEFVTGCFSYFWMLIVYPITPWEITDWFFYRSLDVLPIVGLIFPLIALFANPKVAEAYAKKNA